MIDYLLRREFGTLPLPIPKDTNVLDWKLAEAYRHRDLRMQGLDDPRPVIERRRAEYQSLSDERFLAIVQAAKEEDEKQAESLRQVVEAVRAGAWLQWAKKDLWSEAELAALCCGLIPDERGMPPDPGRTHADAVRILRANDDIRRGTRSETLEFVSRSDEDTASRMYGTARHYVPAVAVEWATSRFDTFPEALLVAVRERTKDMRAVAASSMMKSEAFSEANEAESFASYPPELRAAIEAYTAVRSDPAALAGRSPRQALERWLEENKPEIIGNARKRVLTIANWSPQGGAPKTPGGEPTLGG